MLAALVFAGLSHSHASATPGEISYLPPTDSSAWETVDPARSGGNVKALEDLFSLAKAQKSTGLLIVQDGRILAESYWPVTPGDALTRPRFYSTSPPATSS